MGHEHVDDGDHADEHTIFDFKQIIQYPTPQTMQFNPREQQDSIPVL